MKVIKVYDVKNKKIINEIEAYIDDILALTLSSDDKYLVTVSADKSIKLWDIQNTKLIKSFNDAKSDISCVAISNDNNYIAAGDGYIYIWDLDTKKILTSIKAHTDIINSIDFTHQTDRIISPGGDGKINIWSLADFKPLKVLNNHKEAVLSFNISEDDTLIVLSSDNRSIAIYYLVNEKIVNKFYDKLVVTSVKIFDNNIIFYGNRNGDVKVIEKLEIGSELVTKREHPILNIITNKYNKYLFVFDKVGVFDIIKFDSM